ncbi:hypothetical protein [Streptomyces californicus]|uniref:hypothetical protein n=1 Tax=Streptomyces californicus TaxID=67351 RepID=UPI00296EB70C|nr:hypothetical protein [Streptomyces californicus]MDW4912517.1 hypothetical protein [Streptomyces californicus]
MTTIRVAEDIAARMHRSKDGTVAYCQAAMQKRLGLSERCVAAHIAILRELGLLVWVEKGSSLRNSLRSRRGEAFGPGMGFQRSATIYAPVAPPAWDEAMGHRIDGTGYEARLYGVTEEGRAQAVAQAQDDQQEHQLKPVDNSGSCTPSVSVPQPRNTPASSGSSQDTARTRAQQASNRRSTNRHRAKGSTAFTPQQAAYFIQETRFVKLHTWWTQGSCARQLAHALRPLYSAGWSAEDCARELARWNVPLRPRHVAGYVASEIRRRANIGALGLPDGSVRPYRQVPVRETSEAERRGAMAAKWLAEYGPAWESSAEIRRMCRERLRAHQTPGCRQDRRRTALAEAQPERVLLTSAEIEKLHARFGPFRSGEDLWAEAEQKAAARAQGPTWETAPAAVEPR